MNAELVQLISGLNPHDINLLNKEFKESPKMIALLNFLSHQKNNFSTREAVKEIYNINFDHDDFNKTRNSFFKLRKKLIESIKKETVKEDTILYEYEEKLFQCRKLLNKQQYATAQRQLLELKEIFWRENIFEYLADCIYLLIQVDKIIDGYNHNAILKKLEEHDLAIELKRALQRQQYWNDISFLKDVAAEQKPLEKIRQIAYKYAKYPRFKIIYYYILCLRGIAEPTMNLSIGNAFKKLESMIDEHPKIPILRYVDDHYNKIKGYWLPSLKMHFYMMKRDYLRGFKYMEEYQKILKNNREEYGALQSENLFRNEIIVCILAGKFHEGLARLEDLKNFQTQHGKKDNQHLNHLLLAEIYIHAYPKIKTENFDYLVSRLQETAKSKYCKENPDIRERMMITLGKLLYTYGLHEKSSAIFNDPNIIKKLEYLSMSDITLLFDKKAGIEALTELVPVFSEKLRDHITASQELHYRWAIKMIQKKIKMQTTTLKVQKLTKSAS